MDKIVRKLVKELRATVPTDRYFYGYESWFSESVAGQRILGQSLPEQRTALRTLLTTFQGDTWHINHQNCLIHGIGNLLASDLPLKADDLLALWCWLVDRPNINRWVFPFESIVRATECFGKRHEFPEDLLTRIHQFAYRCQWTQRDLAQQVVPLLGPPPNGILYPGEAWSNQALSDLEAMTKDRRSSWLALLTHCATALAAKPSAKWLRVAGQHLQSIDPQDFEERLLAWFPLVGQPHPEPPPLGLISDPRRATPLELHIHLLKGLVWCATDASRKLARALTDLAIAAYEPVPNVGPRAVKLGNGCLWTLGQLGDLVGVDQLLIVKTRVKYGPAQKAAEKALTTTAKRVGLTPSDLEEIGIPTYGLDDRGVHRIVLGAEVAEIRVSPRGAALHWFRSLPNGEEQD